MELYTPDGLCVQRMTDSTDLSDAALAPTDGARLVALYRLCVRLHQAGDDAILQHGTLALQGTTASRTLEALSPTGSTRAAAASSPGQVWSLSAAGASAALGSAAAHACYPFFLLPQPVPSMFSATATAAPPAPAEPHRHHDHHWVSPTRTASVPSEAYVANTNGAAKGVDDIPLRLCLSATHRGGQAPDEDDEDVGPAHGGVTRQAAEPALALPVLQLQSTERVLECAPVVLPQRAAHAQLSGGAPAQEAATSTLLLSCTASRASEGGSHSTV